MYLGIILIIVACIIGFLYLRKVLIWRDVMLKQNERWFKDSERLKEISKNVDNLDKD